MSNKRGDKGTETAVDSLMEEMWFTSRSTAIARFSAARIVSYEEV